MITKEILDRDLTQALADLEEIRKPYEDRCNALPFDLGPARKAMADAIMAELYSLKVFLNAIGQVQYLQEELAGIARHEANMAAEAAAKAAEEAQVAEPTPEPEPEPAPAKRRRKTA